MHAHRLLFVPLVVAIVAFSQSVCDGQLLRIRDICRVKGQEENSIQGVGLVVGLDGTGGGDPNTIRALANVLQLMGNPVSQTPAGQFNLTDLDDAKNVALVFVTATVPAEGGRQGDQVDCVINSIGAKSLKGGYLLQTPLVGPRQDDEQVYALAQGAIELDKDGPATSAKIQNGCRLEYDFMNQYVDGNRFTLVLDRNHASFQTAFEIEELINEAATASYSEGRGVSPRPHNQEIRAKALDQVNILVSIPELYAADPVGFIADILDTQIPPPPKEALVVVDKRNGVLIVGDNVMVGRVAVSHKNIVVETGTSTEDGPVYILDQDKDTSTTRLKALVDALNALKIKTEDIISIVENLEKSGRLYGRLVVR